MKKWILLVIFYMSLILLNINSVHAEESALPTFHLDKTVMEFNEEKATDKINFFFHNDFVTEGTMDYTVRVENIELTDIHKSNISPKVFFKLENEKGTIPLNKKVNNDSLRGG